jgi:hypothetical protein
VSNYKFFSLARRDPRRSPVFPQSPLSAGSAGFRKAGLRYRGPGNGGVSWLLPSGSGHAVSRRPWRRWARRSPSADFSRLSPIRLPMPNDGKGATSAERARRSDRQLGADSGRSRAPDGTGVLTPIGRPPHMGLVGCFGADRQHLHAFLSHISGIPALRRLSTCTATTSDGRNRIRVVCHLAIVDPG